MTEKELGVGERLPSDFEHGDGRCFQFFWYWGVRMDFGHGPTVFLEFCCGLAADFGETSGEE